MKKRKIQFQISSQLEEQVKFQKTHDSLQQQNNIMPSKEPNQMYMFLKLNNGQQIKFCSDKSEPPLLEAFNFCESQQITNIEEIQNLALQIELQRSARSSTLSQNFQQQQMQYDNQNKIDLYESSSEQRQETTHKHSKKYSKQTLGASNYSIENVYQKPSTSSKNELYSYRQSDFQSMQRKQNDNQFQEQIQTPSQQSHAYKPSFPSQDIIIKKGSQLEDIQEIQPKFSQKQKNDTPKLSHQKSNLTNKTSKSQKSITPQKQETSTTPKHTISKHSIKPIKTNQLNHSSKQSIGKTQKQMNKTSENFDKQALQDLENNRQLKELFKKLDGDFDGLISKNTINFELIDANQARFFVSHMKQLFSRKAELNYHDFVQALDQLNLIREIQSLMPQRERDVSSPTIAQLKQELFQPKFVYQS